MIDSRTAPYAALVLRVTLGALIIALIISLAIWG